MKKVLLISSLIFALASCANASLDVALRASGDNREELQSVIDYFQKSGDRDKVAAAEYIISYMPGHRSIRGDYSAYCDEADSILSNNPAGEEVLSQLHDLSLEYKDRISTCLDIQNIKSEYLIHDIDKAVDQWRDAGWSSHLDFDEFCEWLLPYTCSDSQPLFNWRDSLTTFAEDSLIFHFDACDDYRNNPRMAVIKVNNALMGMISKRKWIKSEHGYSIFRPDVFVKLPGARCDEYAVMAVLTMRSKGIPVGIDFTPQWPDRSEGHSWCVFPNLRGKTSLFCPFSSNPDYPHYPNAEFSKVYRRTYQPDSGNIKLLRRNKGQVPELFRNPFFKDVSEEYMKTIDLTVSLDKVAKYYGRDVYISVFNNKEWKPVACGRRTGRKAAFKSMGMGITYIVQGYKDGCLVPISSPFRVDRLGNIRYIEPEKDSRISFNIDRKFPMFFHVFTKHYFLHGGRIEASNDPEFKTFQPVAQFPQWSLTSGSERVVQSEPFRYWRLCPDEGKLCDMAELFFYEKGSDEPLNRPKLCFTDSTYLSLFDMDPLTYCSLEPGIYKGYVDFGRKVNIDHVSYIRRGDGNAIMPGDEYEIFYWDNGRWRLHSWYQATDVSINVNDIPGQHLYFIQGNSRGTQNRIFAIDETDGRIEWM